MGMESFYINIKANKAEQELMEKDVKNCVKYQKSLLISNSETEITIIGSTFCFLPACCLIYKLCCDISKHKANFVFNTCDEDRSFSFKSKAEFIFHMYSKWEKKLDEVVKQFGAFLIHPSKAYKVQRKLSKRYYTKF
jgi:hypothetical protein